MIKKILFIIFCFLLMDDSYAQDSIAELRGFSSDSIYHNPLYITDKSIPDVTVFDGEDGFYYMLGTEGLKKLELFKSKNLVDWESTNINPVPRITQDEIRNLKQPLDVQYPHIKTTGSLWAPHIFKVQKCFNLYASVGAYGGIICLQSKSPLGPYTFPHPQSGNLRKLVDLEDVGLEFDVIDPCFVRDAKSRKNYLFFGSSFGIYRVELTKDGTSVKKKAKFVHVAGSTDRGKTGVDYEGTMLYWHDGYWYMILSPRRDYRLLCWRSKTLTGVFSDRNGNTPLSDKYGWEILQPQPRNYVTPEGCYLAVAGHAGEIIKDKSGRYFIFCHARISKPNVGSYGHRAPCLTEIVWDEDGWPIANTKDHRVSYENKKPNF